MVVSDKLANKGLKALALSQLIVVIIYLLDYINKDGLMAKIW